MLARPCTDRPRFGSAAPRRAGDPAEPVAEPPVTRSSPPWERVTSRPETRRWPLAVYVGFS